MAKQNSKDKRDFTSEHGKDLAKVRLIINGLIKRLEKRMAEKECGEGVDIEWKYVWGERENAVSALTKLTGLLVKIIPMEQELLEKQPDSNVKKGRALKDDDKVIIRRYLERMRGD